MKPKRWIALDLRVHRNEHDVTAVVSPLGSTQERLLELGPPHAVLALVANGKQLVCFMTTTHAEDLLAVVREVLPERGLAAATASIWHDDPRRALAPATEIQIVDPQPPDSPGSVDEEILNGLCTNPAPILDSAN